MNDKYWGNMRAITRREREGGGKIWGQELPRKLYALKKVRVKKIHKEKNYIPGRKKLEQVSQGEENVCGGFITRARLSK